MSRYCADLHIHLRTSRTAPPQNAIALLTYWSVRKGIQLIGTGDFIDPEWLAEIEAALEQQDSGFLVSTEDPKVHFLLASEIEVNSQIKGRRYQVHLLITAPGLSAARKLSQGLWSLADMKSVRLPRFNLSVSEVVERILSLCPESLVIPAHIWSPWGSLYGSKFGFDSFNDCFGVVSREVFAVETGLSSDPGICWRVSELDGKRIVSFSDAHIPQNVGREFTIFESEFSYEGVSRAIRGLGGAAIKGTVEFCSEMGKYYFNGHRDCKVIKSPVETRLEGKRCPACRKEITIGALDRGLSKADREVRDLKVIRENGWISCQAFQHPPYRKTVPLREIIASTYGIKGRESITVERSYEAALSCGATEYEILLEMSESDLKSFVDPQVTEGILRVRESRFRIVPGYDGVYGQLELFGEKEIADLTQMRLF